MPNVAFRQKSLADTVMCTVLVAEDEPLVRLCIAGTLRELGYYVIEATSASEALEVFASQLPVDVVFSDVEMPGATDGIGLAIWLRRHRPETRVILTSANLYGKPDGEFLEEVDFVSKPYRPEEVAERIQLTAGTGQAATVVEPSAALPSA